MFVKVEYVKWLKEELLKINSVPLEDIIWIENEKLADVDAEVVDNFDFTGLNNVDFIMTGYYKSKI
jgi:predicted ATP-grasp superfamily ATP-dependent carboligase